MRLERLTTAPKISGKWLSAKIANLIAWRMYAPVAMANTMLEICILQNEDATHITTQPTLQTVLRWHRFAHEPRSITYNHYISYSRTWLSLSIFCCIFTKLDTSFFFFWEYFLLVTILMKFFSSLNHHLCWLKRSRPECVFEWNIIDRPLRQTASISFFTDHIYTWSIVFVYNLMYCAHTVLVSFESCSDVLTFIFTIYTNYFVALIFPSSGANLVSNKSVILRVFPHCFSLPTREFPYFSAWRKKPWRIWL